MIGVNMLVDVVGLGKKYNSIKGVWALKGVDFRVDENQRIGIIGPNGSGKSTLLKIIAGMTSATEGRVVVTGKTVALMDLQAGFHPDLTGRESIITNALLVGMSKSEAVEKRDSIIKFADIGKYIDSPYYTYSQGMKFRLAFAVAVNSECDLMILDEIFVAGDSNYQLKVMKTIRKMQKQTGMSTIASSHVLTYVMALSDTFYYMKDGRLNKMTNKEINKLLKKESDMWEKELGVYYGYSDIK